MRSLPPPAKPACPIDCRGSAEKTRSAVLRTTRADRGRCLATGEAVLGGDALYQSEQRHRTVSVNPGAHENASWRSSVSDAAQAAPSNSATRPVTAGQDH